MGENIKLSVLVSLFNSITKAKHSLKRSKFRKFLDTFCQPSDYFASIRLILPSLDRERGNYGLREAQLALALLDALAVSRDSEDAKKLINWRKGGSNNAGTLSGNFALVATDFLQRRQTSVSGNITVRELNGHLDRLSTADRSAKTDILGEMIRKTNWQEMRWIIMIILKDLKLGMSEKTIFQEFHPDAEDLFNVTCDLRFVCEKLRDRNVRHKRQDIEVGKAVRPQYADRATDCGAALKKLRGKDVVVECKFDGFRIQIHKDGGKVNYFSRNFIDHDEYGPGMVNVIVDNVLVDKCILDGELLVWDKSKNCFAPFGKNQEVAKAVSEGLDSERQLCYVAFDILYVGDTSVIHQPLRERHEHLRKVVRPVRGRLEVALPNAHRRADEPCLSIVVNHLDDAEKFLKEMISKLEEGVVFKDLGSKWEPGDRSKAKWIKVKPDYQKVGSDLDVLIIGGYYGAGRRGGEVGQFLVGLAERPAPGTYPRRFVSFCRVGTGVSDEDLDELVTKLKPYFRRYEYPKKPSPSFYQITNHSRERPDVWVENPEKSIIVSISSDVRVISSEVFAAPYALRFPRIDRVRYDKPWHECLDVESFKELVNLGNGTTNRGEPKDATSAMTVKSGRNKRLTLTVPSHFTQTDVSSVKGESQVFSHRVFHFVNVPSDRSLDSMHKLVVENGGNFSMNLNDAVTHCIGAGSRGLKYEAAKRRGCDVIHYSWVFDCCSQKKLLPLMPKKFVFLSDSSRKKLQEDIDEFSDSYFWDLDVAELKQIFCNVNRSEDAQIVDYYKKKYCLLEKWGCFYGCCIYFHVFVKSHSVEWGIFLNISMRRLKVEVSFGGGNVTDSPSQATHIVVMSVPGHELKFEDLTLSFPGDQRYILRRKKLHVVGVQWLEDCFKEQKLPEASYSLKPATLEESFSEEERAENDNGLEKHSALPAHENSKKSVLKTISLIREPKRKRGRAVGMSSRKGETIVSKPPRTKRAKVGSRPAKLQDIASDYEASEQETDAQVKASPELEMHDNVFQDIAFDDKAREFETSTLGKSDSSHDFSGKNEDEKEEYKTDALANASPKHEMLDHAFHENVFDNKPSKRETKTLGVSGLEKNEEHQPECNEMGTRNSSLVTCSKPDKDKEYSSSGIMALELDPIQRMLLGFKNQSIGRRPDATNAVSEGKTLLSTQTLEGEIPTGEPVKKKKVSYKELAKQLLKD